MVEAVDLAHPSWKLGRRGAVFPPAPLPYGHEEKQYRENYLHGDSPIRGRAVLTGVCRAFRKEQREGRYGAEGQG